MASENAIMASLAAINQNLERLNTNVAETNRLVDGLERFVDGLEKRIDEMEKRIDGLGARSRREEGNAAARTWNSRELQQQSTLQPLYSSITNEIISDFPRTKRDMEALSAARVIDILRHLGQVAQGLPDENLITLKIWCGIRSR
ncbi:hypothetical protein F5Y14DRAFT_20636 [Nemania sp. NC0429]|nr:hypothetical protein F5Y14DRAFT_20636 [Nemania sp. NC0429]